MKLARLPYDPAALIDFFQEGLETLGAVCERSWYDRLQLVAEGPAARLWNPEGALLEAEIAFPAPDLSGPRNAEKEVFPGCPLTFRLAEAFLPAGLPLDRLLLGGLDQDRPPAPGVAEKLWQAQKPGTSRWQLAGPFAAAWHFSLLALVRCEIQAIDQHWSLHRVAVSLPDGVPDETLAANLTFLSVAAEPPSDLEWPAPDAAAWQPLLGPALTEDLTEDLERIRRRQENYLRRELGRIDAYFENYERELRGRQKRQRRDEAKIKTDERLAAAKAEHARRRLDQVQRHEIRIIPHLDALLLVAEPAWKSEVSFLLQNQRQTAEAMFVPRTRRWVADVPGLPH